VLAERLEAPALREVAIAQRWADAATLERMAAACRAWAEHPDAFMSYIQCEALGWRE
jgi:hypothetical protein